ncbi:uncharacterized protein C3orf38-like [Penaeus monodon]|uniref:uncharacterized protein C3orf38-like n=1 Tax=Penaeus monodon TaxID=6687 RepID=UPI0018A7A37E|nr:uncharacterized protein C3orf38-like [Penaeus monodon]XP_037782658.1 uncharacterized protein C3orf38-like [Penaeus monodon]
MLLKSPYEPLVQELLGGLEPDALRGLALTATNNRIHPTNCKEAIEIILMHTEDLGKFFSYRRIKAQVLFVYLHHHKVPVNAHSSRTQLAVAVQQFWMKRLNGGSTLTNPKRRSNDKIQEQANPCHPVPPDQLQVVSRQNQAPACLEVVSQENENVKNRQVATLNNEDTLAQIELTKKVKSDDFARVFCEWYYSMINYLQPVCSHQPGDTFRESVFCCNSSVDVYLIGSVREEKHATGQANSYTLLREVFGQTELLFSPNLSSGIQAQKSEHGMIRIFSCGTLHKVNSFVGIYEQEFGLVFCPVDRAWKIMYTKINLKHMSVEPQMPSLPQCEVFSIEQS